MTKYLPYLIGAAILALLIILFTQGKTKTRYFDDRITMNRTDKNPYGAYVAYNNLQYIFPGSDISTNRKEPGYWDSLNMYENKQALVIITPRFLPDEFELNELIRFVKKGNTVFISTALTSYEVTNQLHVEIPDVYDLNLTLSLNKNDDSFYVALMKPPFADGRDFSCPARRYETYFSKYNEATTTVLGNGLYLNPDFIELRAGDGHLFLHLTPLAFSNYFLLHKKNINYYNQALSVIPPDTKRVVWDEYFIRKRGSSPRNDNSSDDGKGILSGLMSNPSFKAAFLLSLLLLLLYALQEMRRKQRFIPELARPKNDSVVFVKTIGRLYYEKGDHLNLARKMAAYFREHVRNRYKLSTSFMNDDFVRTLGMKTAYSEEGIRQIVLFITMIETSEAISPENLASFHKMLEDFYKVG